jgi:hypothetical protein
MSKQVKDLGLYQMEWLNKYNQIHLVHWRMMCLEEGPEWYYVGVWTPGKDINTSYTERKKNLISDKYHYWPKS